MNKRYWLFLVLIFILALSTACGGGEPPAPVDAPPVEELAPPDAPPVEEVLPPTDAPAPAATENEFPLPDDVDAGSVTKLENESINFQTSLSVPDAVTFYRFAFMGLGYVEREILTSVEDAAFSIVFDGHPSGKAIVVQGVNLGESVNINIRFEDI